MDKFKLLDKIKDIYINGGNIINYLQSVSVKSAENTIEDIMISYDFQAGTYIEEYKLNYEFKEMFLNNVLEKLTKYEINLNGRILEVGVGEATTLLPLANMLNKENQYYGFDISWSRIKYAQNFIKNNSNNNIEVFVADLFSIPLADNCMDVVYTCHSIEPNGGREKEILQELYRITRKHLILLEPAFELADKNSKDRMLQHGYVTKLYETAIELGYNIITYELVGVDSNKLNPTGIMIITKNKESKFVDNVFVCPITRTALKKYNKEYYSKDAMLMYPIVSDVSCLTKQNAIVATKFIETMDDK